MDTGIQGKVSTTLLNHLSETFLFDGGGCYFLPIILLIFTNFLLLMLILTLWLLILLSIIMYVVIVS